MEKTMNNHEPLFKEKIINAELNEYHIEQDDHFITAHKVVKKWKKSIESGNLDATKEVSVQGQFLTTFFKHILDYNMSGDGADEWMLEQESKVAHDSTVADGSLGFFTNDTRDVRAVIELKDAKTDLDKKQNRARHLTPVEQGFSYAYKNGAACKWVIISNFKEIRLYRSNSSLEYEVFFVTDFDDIEKFKRFYFILSQKYFIQKDGTSIIDQVFVETEQAEEDISDQFYNDYAELRSNLFESLKANNLGHDALTLFSKTQKIMDRFLFICFAEDKSLLPAHLFAKILESAKHSFIPGDNKIWMQLNGLFKSINQGNPSMDINGYNGGLFKEDLVLDGLIIPDEILSRFSLLSDKDFQSDINVNILGHVFEHSLADIEKIKNSIKGVTTADATSKRKKDGIFYTKEYITDYIVEKTVGRWMDDKKQEIIHSMFSEGGYKIKLKGHYINGKKEKDRKKTLENWQEIPDSGAVDKYEREAIIFAHIAYYEKYAQSLKDLRIIDPTCGSGAFLNAALKFVSKEIRFVNDILNSLRGGALSMLDIDKQILENNLYGVDINEESVEITKLSLWLQTAKKGQMLTSLDHAIKCGNSIIDNEAVAGNLAFKWEVKFADIMADGGFDICIGNPPYGATLGDADKHYIKNKYITTEGGFDTYKTFFELGINLIKSDGYLGYITPNTYFSLVNGAKKLRHFLFDNNTLLNVVEVFNVFDDAVVEPLISIYQKSVKPWESLDITLVPRDIPMTSTFYFDGTTISHQQSELKEDKDYLFNYKTDVEGKKIHDEILSRSVPLQNVCSTFSGIKPYESGKGIPKQTKEMVKTKPFNNYSKIDETWHPFVKGKSIKRYKDVWDGEYIKYGPWLAAPRNAENLFCRKIMVRETGDNLTATLDVEGKINDNTVHALTLKNDEIQDVYILGLLNSKLFHWIYYFENTIEDKKPLAKVKLAFIKRLPIIIANLETRHKVTTLVDELLIKNQSIVVETNKLLNYIKSTYEPDKLTEKLETFYTLSFKEFIAELMKKKVRLKASEQMDLLQVFENQSNTISKLQAQIQSFEYELDQIVYSIYHLANADIQYIESHQ